MPDPWDLSLFVQDLAERRGRTIQILPVPIDVKDKTICGAWVPLPAGDVVFVRQHTSEWHQEQIVLHECAHMICGHAPSPTAVAQFVAQMLPAGHWDPDVVAKVLLRSRYDTPIEQQAERVADLIEDRADRRPARPRLIDLTEPDEAEVLRRFARALGMPAT